MGRLETNPSTTGVPILKAPINVTVETYLPNSEDPESERTINHADNLHRQWLEKHTFWAMRNGREVVIRPQEVGE